MTDLSTSSAFEASTPGIGPDALVRSYDSGTLVWPANGVPVLLDAVGGVILQILDGESPIGELADDIADVISIPRSIAVTQLRTVVDALDAAGALTSSRPVAPPIADGDLFYGPLNP